MNIRLHGGLPYVSVTLIHNGRSLALDWVVLDTGSGASVFSTDELLQIGIAPAPDDVLKRVIGIGGKELVVAKRIEAVVVDDMELRDFEIQVGAMRYGFPIQGILGMNFLLHVGAVIDLKDLELRKA